MLKTCTQKIYNYYIITIWRALLGLLTWQLLGFKVNVLCWRYNSWILSLLHLSSGDKVWKTLKSSLLSLKSEAYMVLSRSLTFATSFQEFDILFIELVFKRNKKALTNKKTMTRKCHVSMRRNLLLTPVSYEIHCTNMGLEQSNFFSTIGKITVRLPEK